MSKKQPKLVPEDIIVVDFNILKGSIECPSGFDLDEVENHNYEICFSTEFALDIKVVRAVLDVDVETESNKANEQEAEGSFQFEFLYSVENLNDLAILDEEDGDVEVHYPLLNALASITYSTSRGILMTRFQGTGLSNFILPVIDPDELID